MNDGGGRKNEPPGNMPSDTFDKSDKQDFREPPEKESGAALR